MVGISDLPFSLCRNAIQDNPIFNLKTGKQGLSHTIRQLHRTTVRRPIIFILVFSVVFLFASPAFSRLVNNVDIRTRSTGYEIRVEYFLPMRYVSHRPKTKGNFFVIQMRPSVIGLNDPETIQELGERQILSWDRSTGIPLREMIYEGGVPDRPELILRFTRDVKFEVKNSGDLRTLIITVHTEKPKEPEKEPEPEAALPETAMPTPDLSKGTPKMSELMDEAGGAMIDRNFRRAIQLYTKVLRNPDTVFRQDAQELLGLARHRNGQMAHARAEYEKYLKLYPEGPGADRVRQRLSGLLTAASKPKGKLRKAKRPEIGSESDWDHQLFGSLSELYIYSDSRFQDGTTTTNQSQLLTSLDFNTRSRSDRYEIQTQFFGTHEADLRNDGSGDRVRVNNLYVDLEDRKWELSGRFGRQSRSSGGVFGRFDGGLISYNILPEVKVNGVFGYPVDTSSDSGFNTDKHFYGASVDLGTFWDSVDLNLFAINQEIESIVDRQSVGGEVRYFHPTRSFFSFVDYDTSYSELNIFLINGGWTFPTKTRLNLVLDYRRSPILSTSNALIGQTAVTSIPGLLNSLTEDQIRQLALDRTATNKSVTIGIVQDLNEKYQAVAELTISEQTATPASPSVPIAPVVQVPATQSTGKEYFYLTQLIASSFFMEGDINIIELRYADTMSSDSFSFNLNLRYPFTPDFRVNPRIQTNYRKNKSDGGKSVTIRPLVRIDYRWKKWLRFEMEGGREWREDTIIGNNTEKTTGYFATVGFRAYF